MKVTEIQRSKAVTGKTKCDLCFEEPENGALVEKPNSAIINGQLYVYQRPEPLYVCLNCLHFELENM